MDTHQIFEVITEHDRLQMLKNAIPDNTRKRNNWSFRIFKEWIEWKKQSGPLKVALWF